MKRDIPSFFLYLFSFLLLWEWLRPVEQITDTTHMKTFLVFLLLCLVLSFLQVKWVWKIPIKLIFILVSINQIHYVASFFHKSWLIDFGKDFIANISLLMGRQWADLSDEFRTLLFFILLWLMVYLIEYWLLRRQHIFLFFLMTLIYVTVLDTFTAYQANTAIVRTVVSGFAVMGMLTFYRMVRQETTAMKRSSFRKWMIPLAGMIVLSVAVGLVAPKAAPIWPDPVPYLTAEKEQAGGDGNGTGPHRIGYGTDDSKLGGPFIGNDNPVFAYEGSGKNYWRMETKDTYTGKGWLVSGTSTLSFSEGDPVPLTPFPGTVETVEKTAKVIVNGSYHDNYFMYPVGITKFLDVQPSSYSGDYFELEEANERISYFTSDQQAANPSSFTVIFNSPKYNSTDLRTTTSPPPELNQDFYKQYTLLPENLPGRVKELAEIITAGKTNWFDKAKAVETYFANTEYTYDQKDVAVPGKDDDYVDQFLFETKRGYCDNFSSSMAVLLRTIGIPTRWIKGFTGGTFSTYGDDSASTQVYEVTNNNAHSWVEVYFPNQGWVPFEPTKGFTNDVTINYQVDTNAAANHQEPEQRTVEKPQKEEVDQPKTTTEPKTTFDLQTIWNMAKEHWVIFLLSLLLLAGLVVMLYLYRGKWVPYGLLIRYRFKKKDESLPAAYLILLNQLDRYGLKRKDHQTLRAYALYIDTFFSSREMTRLTALYEGYIYHQQLPKGSWGNSRELWENLIKKTIA